MTRVLNANLGALSSAFSPSVIININNNNNNNNNNPNVIGLGHQLRIAGDEFNWDIHHRHRESHSRGARLGRLCAGIPHCLSKTLVCLGMLALGTSIIIAMNRRS